MHWQSEVLPVRRESTSQDKLGYGISFTETDVTQNPSGKEPLYHAQLHCASDTTRNSLQAAAAHLRAGELVAFPTETVYGLGACALKNDAAAKIYAAKSRPADNPLIVHVSDRRMLERLLPTGYKPNAVCETLLRAFWPGPLTLLFPARSEASHEPAVPPIVTCGQPTVGVRMPSHPLARALIHMADMPVAAPSANASGRPSPTTAGHVFDDLGRRGSLKYILDGGPSTVGVESTVIDAVSVPGEVRVLRPGGVSVEQLADALAAHGLLRMADGAKPEAVTLRVYGKDLARSKEAELAPTTPGMKYRHYSPEARVVLARFEENTKQGASLSQLIKAQLDALRVNAHGATPDNAMTQRRQTGPFRVGVMCALDSPLASLVRQLATDEGQQSLGQWADAQLAEDRASDPAVATDGTQRVSPVVPSASKDFCCCIYSLGCLSKPQLAAQHLFDGLRTLDSAVQWADGATPQNTCDLILVEAISEQGVGLAVMNRLQKAASETNTISSV